MKPDAPPPASMTSRASFVPAAAFLAALLACGPPPEPGPAAARPGSTGIPTSPTSSVAHSLVRQFPAAVTRREMAAIDLGTAAARRHLIRGWSADEKDRRGTFVWGLGNSSELEFFAAGTAAVTLVLRGRTFSFEGAPSQLVSVAVNDRPIAEVEVGGRLELPSGAVQPGTNRLQLGYRYHRSPSQVLPGSADDRPPAVQWYGVEFRGLGSEGSPRLGRSGDPPVEDRIEIPLGASVSYYFRVEPGQQLVIGDLDPWGGSCSLAVSLTTADGTTTRVVDSRSAELPARVELATARRTFAHLALSVTRPPSRSSGRFARAVERLFGDRGDSGLSLLLPMVMQPQPTAAPEVRQGPAPGPQTAESSGESSRPNVLIYLIDTLRADHLGLYGYGRPTSPRIDRFARDSVVFTNAQAQSSWTRTSVVSLLTGLLPQVHGVNRREDAVAPPIDTLAEILQRAGYETAGLVTNGNISSTFGLGQGFDSYRHLKESPSARPMHQLSDQLNRRTFNWLDVWSRAGDRPFFLYLHATDPHAPYTPPEPFRQRFAPGVDPAVGWLGNVDEITNGQRTAPEGTREALIDLYDGEIAFNDQQFGRLVDQLKALGIYDQTLIVLLSDHGEEFLDHGGWQHGRTLYGEQLRVPLVVKLPRGEAAGLTTDVLASHIDVLPTVLDVLGLEPPPRVDGRSLLPALAGARRETPFFSYLRLAGRDMRSVTAGGWKLILDAARQRRGEAPELFRIAADLSEAPAPPAVHSLEAEFLRQALRGLDVDLRRRSRFRPQQAEMSDELRDRLKALGYLN